MTNVVHTSIQGLYVIARPAFPDERGFFKEVFRKNEFQKETKINFSPLQWNHSLSLPGVIRGLHAENWNKLVYPVTGSIFIAIVDIRPKSKTFAKVETFTLTSKNRHALYISKGLANSICVIGDQPVNYLYLVDAYYDGSDTRAIAYNDPDLNITWPIKNPLISQRDKDNPLLKNLFPNKFKKNYGKAK